MIIKVLPENDFDAGQARVYCGCGNLSGPKTFSGKTAVVKVTVDWLLVAGLPVGRDGWDDRRLQLTEIS
jgi:hypothetical protein